MFIYICAARPFKNHLNTVMAALYELVVFIYMNLQFVICDRPEDPKFKRPVAVIQMILVCLTGLIALLITTIIVGLSIVKWLANRNGIPIRKMLFGKKKDPYSNIFDQSPNKTASGFNTTDAGLLGKGGNPYEGDGFNGKGSAGTVGSGGPAGGFKGGKQEFNDDSSDTDEEEMARKKAEKARERKEKRDASKAKKKSRKKEMDDLDGGNAGKEFVKKELNLPF